MSSCEDYLSEDKEKQDWRKCDCYRAKFVVEYWREQYRGGWEARFTAITALWESVGGQADMQMKLSFLTCIGQERDQVYM